MLKCSTSIILIYQQTRAKYFNIIYDIKLHHSINVITMFSDTGSIVKFTLQFLQNQMIRYNIIDMQHSIICIIISEGIHTYQCNVENLGSKIRIEDG